MSELLKTTLAHLRELVRFDTQNPPRAIGREIFDYLGANLSGFDLQLDELGDGCTNLLASRGRPQLLFNFHIDTVPAGPHWQSDPFDLEVADGRATGLGACDIKGAAACMLSAAAHAHGDVGLLFSSDEEAGNSRCIGHFLEREHQYRGAVVAEPTCAKAVLAHRGIGSAYLRFRGVAGHASDARALDDSAVHRAVRWAGRALEFAERGSEDVYENLRGFRFNIGRIEGGVKPNVIAAGAEMKFGVRALPGRDSAALLTQFFQLAEPHEIEDAATTFHAPSLPTGRRYPPPASLALAQSLGLEPGDPVDFWTEAALFSAAGIPSVVFGPGDIAQAHTAGEWVALEQLETVTSAYARILS